MAFLTCFASHFREFAAADDARGLRNSITTTLWREDNLASIADLVRKTRNDLHAAVADADAGAAAALNGMLKSPPIAQVYYTSNRILSGADCKRFCRFGTYANVAVPLHERIVAIGSHKI